MPAIPPERVTVTITRRSVARTPPFDDRPSAAREASAATSFDAAVSRRITASGASGFVLSILEHSDAGPAGPNRVDLLRPFTVLRLGRRKGGIRERGEVGRRGESTRGQGSVPD